MTNYPVVPLGNFKTVAVTKLRIGVYSEDGVLASSPAVRRAVKEAANALANAGATIIEWKPPRISDAYHLSLAIFTADGGKLFKELLRRDPVHPSLKTMLALAGRSRPTLSLLRSLAWAFGQRSLANDLVAFGNTRTIDYWRLSERLARYRAEFDRAVTNADGGALDCILGPACALPAFRHGATAELGTAGAHTLLYNVLGYPAGIVPVTRVRENEESDRPATWDIVQLAATRTESGSAGLPIAVQIAARPWQDHIALAAMRAVEQRVGWSEQRPDKIGGRSPDDG
jgi:fatty acid amide hydrolase